MIDLLTKTRSVETPRAFCSLLSIIAQFDQYSVVFLNHSTISFYVLVCYLVNMDYEFRMKKAMLAVKQGASYRDAAKDQQLSHSSLQCRLNKPNRECPNRRGPPGSFTNYELDTFATLVKSFDKWEQPLSRRKFLKMVKTEANRLRESNSLTCYL